MGKWWDLGGVAAGKTHTEAQEGMLAPRPAGVEGRFVREIMLLLDGISVGGQSTREREGSPL